MLCRINQTAYSWCEARRNFERIVDFRFCIVSITELYSNQMTGPQIACKGPPTEWYGPRRPHRVPGPPNLHFNHWVRVRVRDLGATYEYRLTLIGKRVADFLLVLIGTFSLGRTAEALRAIIGSKSAISLQLRVLADPKFQVGGPRHRPFFFSEN